MIQFADGKMLFFAKAEKKSRSVIKGNINKKKQSLIIFFN